MRLGALATQAQAQLDGFKSRGLRAATTAPAQRHLYVTEWHAVDVEGESLALLVSGDVSPLQAPRTKTVAAMARSGDWTLGVVATRRAASALMPLSTLAAALSLVKMQAAAAPARSVWLLTTATQQAAGGAAHAGTWESRACSSSTAEEYHASVADLAGTPAK